MRSLVVVIALAIAAPAAAEPRSVAPFSTVDAEGRFRVEVAPGPGYAAEITGADRADITARVVDGVLRLRDPDGEWFGSRKRDATVRVLGPAIAELRAARGAEMRASGLGGAQLSLSASQGGVLTAAGESEAVTARAAMGGVLTVSGACGALLANASMGGVIEAEALACREVRARASMGGAIGAQASGAAEANASMGGIVNVEGAPARRASRTSMGGGVSFD